MAQGRMETKMDRAIRYNYLSRNAAALADMLDEVRAELKALERKMLQHGDIDLPRLHNPHGNEAA